MKLKNFREHLIPNLILIIYYSIVIFTAVSAPILATRWHQSPFLGGLIEPGLHFKKFARIIPSEDWPIQELGWGLETQLIALDGNNVTSSQEIATFLASKKPGDSIDLTIATESGGKQTETIDLSTFTLLDRFTYIYLPFIAGLACLVFSILLISDQRKQPLSIAFSVLSLNLALILFTYFDFFTTHTLSPLLFLGIGMGAASLIQITILLPRQKYYFSEPTWISFAAYPPNLILIGLGIFQLQNPLVDLNYFLTLSLLLASFGISVLALTVYFVFLRAKVESPLIERQSETIFGATLLSFLPLYILLTASLISAAEPPVNPLFLLPLCVLPVTFGLLKRRYTLPQTYRHLYRSLIYIFLTCFFGIAYTLLIFLLNLVLITPLSPNNALAIGGMVFIVLLTFEPLRRRLEAVFNIKSISLNMSKGNLALDYTAKLTAADSQDVATKILRDAITEIMQPEQLHIFLYSPEIPGFTKIDPDDLQNKNDYLLPTDTALASTLKKLRTSLYIQPNTKLPISVQEDDEFLSKLNARLHVPIPGNYGLLGWISIGNKPQDEAYTASDINLLESLSTQFALVYERSDTIESLHHRLKEMEILNQIAIAINNITDFDQLLMSIFTHTQKILRIDRFSLVMEIEKNGLYQRQFQYQDGKRIISTREPQALPPEFPEKQTIVKGESTILDQNGTWLIVPLEKEDRTIGALSLGSSGDKSIFDRTDLGLIDSIASLVTGAIIKTGLLQASQSQTQHLALLNKVSQQLTSTLVLEPLLNTIVNSAMEILNSTSGILMTVDETTDELVFEVTAGPIGLALQGKRLPKREGVAGESYFAQKPIIRNNIDPADMYLNSSVPGAISKIKNILAVPLITQGEVIGVLEIINKKNDLSFTESDLQVLEGFASQAAVAMQNATLYTKTDQALEERIDELYTMQQIDLKLHSSQEITEALKTMLQAALSHTRACCATIALVDTYDHTLDNIWQMLPEEHELLPLEKIDLRTFPWFSKDSNEPFQIVDSSDSELAEILHVPQQCEAHFLIKADLGEDQYSLLILHLDSLDILSAQDIEFLVRLNNHAAIALRNAILYEYLQDAILAKNEFISFISHELKNPLTAIKGHADILAKGMVGEINEEQADFLRTISHNVHRMNTFITDLSDQSRIETKSLRMIFESTSVNEVVDEVLQSYAQQLKEKSIEIQRKIKTPIPNVWCDRLRLIQVLSNLVSNAIKYTSEGGKIEISADYAINKWDNEGAAEVVHFQVKDNGYGISYEDQEHLFEKFFRGTSDQILIIPGSGLGLRISKSLTKIMGGTMWFESAPGEGSTFHFTMPI